MLVHIVFSVSTKNNWIISKTRLRNLAFSFGNSLKNVQAILLEIWVLFVSKYRGNCWWVWLEICNTMLTSQNDEVHCLSFFSGIIDKGEWASKPDSNQKKTKIVKQAHNGHLLSKIFTQHPTGGVIWVKEISHSYFIDLQYKVAPVRTFHRY